MTGKKILASLVIVGLVVFLFLLLSNSDFFKTGKHEQIDSVEIEDQDTVELDEEISQDEKISGEDDKQATGENDDLVLVEVTEFVASAEPYKAYTEALENSKPVVLEFYAHT